MTNTLCAQEAKLSSYSLRTYFPALLLLAACSSPPFSAQEALQREGGADAPVQGKPDAPDWRPDAADWDGGAYDAAAETDAEAVESGVVDAGPDAERDARSDAHATYDAEVGPPDVHVPDAAPEGSTGPGWTCFYPEEYGWCDCYPWGDTRDSCDRFADRTDFACCVVWTWMGPNGSSTVCSCLDSAECLVGRPGGVEVSECPP